MPLGELGPILIEIPLLALLAYVRTLHEGRVQSLYMALRIRPEWRLSATASDSELIFLLAPGATHSSCPESGVSRRTPATTPCCGARRCAVVLERNARAIRSVADSLRLLLRRSFDSGDFFRARRRRSRRLTRVYTSPYARHRRLAGAGLRY